MKRDLIQLGLVERWYITIRFYSNVGWYWKFWFHIRKLGIRRISIDLLWIALVLEDYK